MDIRKCVDSEYYKKDCFIECNNMYKNILVLQNMENKLNKYENLLDDATSMKVYDLNKDFQKKFLSICVDYMKEYDRIINDKY